MQLIDRDDKAISSMIYMSTRSVNPNYYDHEIFFKNKRHIVLRREHTFRDHRTLYLSLSLSKACLAILKHDYHGFEEVKKLKDKALKNSQSFADQLFPGMSTLERKREIEIIKYNRSQLYLSNGKSQNFIKKNLKEVDVFTPAKHKEKLAKLEVDKVNMRMYFWSGSHRLRKIRLSYS
jgi:hypothetical protein